MFNIKRRSRWILIIAIAVVAMLLIVFYRLRIPDTRSDLRKSYDAIKVGMTEQEVEGILGKPGDHRVTTRPIGRSGGNAIVSGETWPDGSKYSVWQFDEKEIWVDYSPTAAVTGKTWGGPIENMPYHFFGIEIPREWLEW
jgi:hypothetical protein